MDLYCMRFKNLGFEFGGFAQDPSRWNPAQPNTNVLGPLEKIKRMTGVYSSSENRESRIVDQRELVTTYPNAGLRSDQPVDAKAKFVELGPEFMLSFKGWDERSSEPFTDEELEIFGAEEAGLDNWTGVNVTPLADFDLTHEDVRRIRHTYYDRRTGKSVAWIAVDTNDGETQYLKVAGKDTTEMDKLKGLLPKIDTLVESNTILQVSAGNQGDLIGNFTIHSDGENWKLFSANNEPWGLPGKSYKAFVALSNDGKNPVSFV